MGTGHLSCQTPPARLAITQYINAGLAEVCSIHAFTLCNTPSREPSRYMHYFLAREGTILPYFFVQSQKL